MNPKNGKVPTITDLSNHIVSSWVSTCGINLRVGDGIELQRIIKKSISKNPRLQNDQPLHPHEEVIWRKRYERWIEAVKLEERKRCVEAIAELREEPFTGFVSKQRALNALECQISDEDFLEAQAFARCKSG